MLVGIRGMRVLGVVEVDGEVELLVETDQARTGCPECGVIPTLHGRRETVVRDVAAFDRRARLRWRKRVWRCDESVCGRRTWTEQHAAVRPRASLTERARQAAARRVAAGESVAAVARDLGVGWHTVNDAFTEHTRRLLDDQPLAEEAEEASDTEDGAGGTADVQVVPLVLGLDEHAWQRARRRRRTQYATVFVEGRTGLLLDLVQGRSAAAASDWLAAQTADWRRRVAVAAVDPFEGYARAVRQQLPDATLVVDHFHAIRLGNRVLDEVRRRTQQQVLGHRGRKGDPLYRARKLLLMSVDRLDAAGFARLEQALSDGDPDDEVYTAWSVKELLRDVYAADDVDAARAALDMFYEWAADSAVPECRRLARTVRRWQPQILAWHTTSGASNGPTEAANLIVKKVARIGHGFRNWENYRLRVLAHCRLQWHDQPATRIRGRKATSPRFVA